MRRPCGHGGRRHRSNELFSAALLLIVGLAPTASAQQIELISRAHPSLYSDAAGASPMAALSADGRYLAFHTESQNMVPAEVPNGFSNVYLYDRLADTTMLVSRALGSATTGGDGASHVAAISGDGAYVVFVSDATNLVAGQIDTNAGLDVFLFERATGGVTLVSHAAGAAATAANRHSSAPVITPDASYVLFGGPATNLVAGQVDTNGLDDVFLFERASATVTLVSRATAGAGRTGDNYSLPGSLSADGRYVAFESYAMDLVPGQVDTYFQSDVFLFDRMTGQTLLVSHEPGSSVVSAGNGGGPIVSADGNFVAFESASVRLVPGQLGTGGLINVFLYDRRTEAVALITHVPGSSTLAGNGQWSAPAAISASGDQVLFASSGTNLVAGQVDVNVGNDVFTFERSTGVVTLVSHAAGSPTRTANKPSYVFRKKEYGSRVAFYTSATDVVAGQVEGNGWSDVFVADPAAGTITLVSHTAGSPDRTANHGSEYFVQSADGDYIAFFTFATDLDISWTDYNMGWDLVLYEAATGAMRGISRRDPDLPALSPGSDSGPDGISADGRFVVFSSMASNVVEGQLDGAESGPDVFLVDRSSGATTLVSHRSDSPLVETNRSGLAVISSDGNYVAFLSSATDLVTGQVDSNGGHDVFLFDRTTGVTTLVSHAADSDVVTANARVYETVAISDDGRFVVFDSWATNLVIGQVDSNGGPDVFVFDRVAGVTTLVSRSVLGPTVAGNGASGMPTVDASGDAIAFESGAGDLVPGHIDGGSGADVYLFSKSSGNMTLVSHVPADALLTANSTSARPVVSADGSHVAFYSMATNLVPLQDDTEATFDVFLFARGTGAVMLVSRAAGTVATTTAGYFESLHPLRLSADGGLVAFGSSASNLISGQDDPNGDEDVFLFDRVAQSMTLVSRAAGSSSRTGTSWSALAGISADGRTVVFVSGASDLLDEHEAQRNLNVFAFLPDSEMTLLVSRSDEEGLSGGNGPSSDAHVSRDGDHVLFGSFAGDLVRGDFNQRNDVFVFGPVRTVADLTVNVAVTPDPVGGGGILTYAITVVNLGTELAYDITVTDSLPPEVVLVGAAGLGWHCDASGDAVTCTRAALTPGAAPEILVRVRAPLAAGVLVNVVSVTSSADPEPANDHAIVETGVDSDLIFRDSFESGTVAAWSVTNPGGGDLGITASAAMASTPLGLEGTVNDTASIFVEDRTPLDEDRYRARFYLDPSGFDPGETQGALRARVFLALEDSPTRRLLAVVLRRRAGQYALMVKVRRDDDSHVETGFFDITAGPHAVELQWRRATSSIASDGELRLWIDGTPMATLTGLSTNRSSVDTARMGGLSLKAGASGVLLWDHFESRRSTYIGP